MFVISDGEKTPLVAFVFNFVSSLTCFWLNCNRRAIFLDLLYFFQGCVFPGSGKYPKLIGLEVRFFSQEILYAPYPRVNNASI